MAAMDVNIKSLKWSVFSLGTYKSIIKTTPNKSISHVLFVWNSELTLKQDYSFLLSTTIFYSSFHVPSGVKSTHHAASLSHTSLALSCCCCFFFFFYHKGGIVSLATAGEIELLYCTIPSGTGKHMSPGPRGWTFNVLNIPTCALIFSFLGKF